MGRNLNDYWTLTTQRQMTRTELSRKHYSERDARRITEKRAWEEFYEQQLAFEESHKIDWTYNPTLNRTSFWRPHSTADAVVFEIRQTYLLKPSLWLRVQRVLKIKE